MILSKRNKKRGRVRAEAIAKIEASAKATYKRTRITTEIVPPDVSRAKAGAWLDAISPITEWAGLKGDALRYRRQQLRIQQEATLDRLAASIRKKMKGRSVEYPLPPKILVPALEAASLEDPSSPLTEWWANLFVAGATGSNIRPYHVDLMKVIVIEEAACLKQVWDRFSTREEYLSGQYEAGPNTTHRLMDVFELELAKFGDHVLAYDQFLEKIMNVLHTVHQRLEAEELPITITISQSALAENQGHRLSFILTPPLLDFPVPVDVCLTLNLLTTFERTFSLFSDRLKIKVPAEIEPTIAIKVYYPSALGIEFLKACQPTSESK